MSWRTDKTIFQQSLLQLICILSILGALITIISYAVWLDIRTKSRRLLLHLAAADVLSAGSLLYGLTEFFHRNSINCKVQSFLSTIANIAQLAIYIIISVYVFTAVCSREKYNELIRKYGAYICWIVSIIIGIYIYIHIYININILYINILIYIPFYLYTYKIILLLIKYRPT